MNIVVSTFVCESDLIHILQDICSTKTCKKRNNPRFKPQILYLLAIEAYPGSHLKSFISIGSEVLHLERRQVEQTIWI